MEKSGQQKNFLILWSGIFYLAAIGLYLGQFPIYLPLVILGIHLVLVFFTNHRLSLDRFQSKKIIIVGIICFVMARIAYTWIIERDFPVIYKSPERFVIHLFLALWSSTPLLWSLLTFFKAEINNKRVLAWAKALF